MEIVKIAFCFLLLGGSTLYAQTNSMEEELKKKDLLIKELTEKLNKKKSNPNMPREVFFEEDTADSSESDKDKVEETADSQDEEIEKSRKPSSANKQKKKSKKAKKLEHDDEEQESSVENGDDKKPQFIKVN